MGRWDDGNGGLPHREGIRQERRSGEVARRAICDGPTKPFRWSALMSLPPMRPLRERTLLTQTAQVRQLCSSSSRELWFAPASWL